jgi:hypothetical protein
MKEDELDRACSMHGEGKNKYYGDQGGWDVVTTHVRDEKCVQNFGRKT